MLTFREPTGYEVEEPTVEYLRSRVLDADLSYWEGPAGDAGLFRQHGDQDGDLVLLVQAEGALVFYRDYVAGEHKVLVGGPARGEPEWVDVYDGQETISIARRFLVPREIAWRAVAEFARSGDAAPGLQWEDGLQMQE